MNASPEMEQGLSVGMQRRPDSVGGLRRVCYRKLMLNQWLTESAGFLVTPEHSRERARVPGTQPPVRFPFEEVNPCSPDIYTGPIAADRSGQASRTGRATFGLRAELAVCRFASLLGIRRTAWLWWNALNASVTALTTNIALVWPSAGAETIPSGMSLDQPLAARNPLTMYEKYGHAWSRCASSIVTIFPVNSHSTRP
jgi:hypothetical protein